MKHLTEVAVMAWNIAGAEAMSAKFELIEKEHLFISLTEIKKLMAPTAGKLGFTPEQIARAEAEAARIDAIFSGLSISQDRMRRRVRSALGPGRFTSPRGDIHRSVPCRKIFERARVIAGTRNYISGMDLLWALAEDPGPIIAEAFRKYNVEPEQFLSAIKLSEMPAPAPAAEKKYSAPGGLEMLLAVGKDLSAACTAGTLSKISGRANELAALVQGLDPASGKIPLLVGPQGIGKGMLAGAVAWLSLDPKAPPYLRGAAVLEIGADDLLKNSSTHGGFSKLLAKLVSEIESSSGVVVYIRDIHNFLDMAAREGGSGISPLIYGGSARLVCATDEEGFSRFIAKDAALSSRFAKIVVPEPSAFETAAILKEYRLRFENDYSLRVSEKAMVSALDLAYKMPIPGANPKKAISLLDKACQKARMPAGSVPAALLAEMTTVAHQFNLDMTPDVHEGWVVAVAAEAAQKPMALVASKLRAVTQARAAGIGATLKTAVIGQDEAADLLAKSLRDSYGKSDKPLVFMFAGAKGVGKTEMARAISTGLFGAGSETLYYEMERYNRPESLKNVFGSGDGSGVLPQALCERPKSVVVFENTENTMPLFYEYLGEFLKRGVAADFSGRKVPLSGAIFVLTTAVFSRSQGGRNPASSPAELVKRVKTFLPPQFYGQLSGVVPFAPLSEAMASKVLLVWLGQLRNRFRDEFHINLSVAKSVESLLIERGLDPERGVRQLKMTFDEMVNVSLQNVINRRLLSQSQEWRVAAMDGAVVFLPKLPQG